MNKPDWFKFYPEKWLASKTVRRMSLPARAVYFDLLCEAWHQTPPGSLPDDDAAITDLAGVKPSVWAKVGPEVRKAFVRGDDGRIYQPFMAGPVANAAYSKSEKARAAANARWNADAMQTHSNGIASAMHPVCHQEGEEERESEGEERVSVAVAGGVRGEVQERGATPPHGMTPAQQAVYATLIARPLWLPSDREWIEATTARGLALRSTSTPAHVAYWLGKAGARRREVRDVNLAGFVIGKLDKPDMALVESLSAQEVQA